MLHGSTRERCGTTTGATISSVSSSSIKAKTTPLEWPTLRRSRGGTIVTLL